MADKKRLAIIYKTAMGKLELIRQRSSDIYKSIKQRQSDKATSDAINKIKQL